VIRYRLETPFGDVAVSLPTDDPRATVAIAYEGDAGAVEFVRSWLEVQWGRDGHMITSETTALDLEIAFAHRSASVMRPRRMTS
jgi:hypothetical protein